MELELSACGANVKNYYVKILVLSHIVWVATYIIYHEDHEGK